MICSSIAVPSEQYAHCVALQIPLTRGDQNPLGREKIAQASRQPPILKVGFYGKQILCHFDLVSVGRFASASRVPVLFREWGLRRGVSWR